METPRLIVDHLSYSYDKEAPGRRPALSDVSFKLDAGEFIGLIGHTGSGKSTLVQLMDALLKPGSGSIYYEGADIFAPDYDRKALHGKIGLVFQYPEYQLFEETVLAEAAYGPKNMGASAEEADLAAIEALGLVGLSGDYYDQSPFDLSGGQKRRVAIASVLSMKPKLLILDEPTAGLDPAGRVELLKLVKGLRDTQKLSVVLVSHSMEDVAELADRIIVLDGGKLLYDAAPREVFSHAEELERIGLGVPAAAGILHSLARAGLKVDESGITLAEAKEAILKALA